MIRVDSREITTGDLSQWDELVEHSPQGTIFHKPAWLNACAEFTGKSSKFLGVSEMIYSLEAAPCSLERNGVFSLMPNPIADLHLTVVLSLLLPRLQVCINRKCFPRQVIESLTGCIEKEHYLSIVLWNPPEFLDIRPFIAHGWRSHLQYTYDFDLGVNIESHIDTRLKKTMRRAEKEQFIFESSTDISKFYSLLCETYARKNLKPAASKRFISDVCLFLRDQNCGEMVVAKTPGGEITCAEIVVWDTKKAYRWAAASDARFLESGAPSLLLFTVLKRMQERSVKKINLMGANTPKLSRFIARFNPTLVPYYQIKSGIFDRILSLKK